MTIGNGNSPGPYPAFPIDSAADLARFTKHPLVTAIATKMALAGGVKRQEAEELAQQALSIMADSLQKEGIRNGFAKLQKIVWVLAFSLARHGKVLRQRPLKDSARIFTVTPHDDAIFDETKFHLALMLETLDLEEAIALQCTAYGLKLREVAVALEVSVSSVSRMREQAIAKLQKLYTRPRILTYNFMSRELRASKADVTRRLEMYVRPHRPKADMMSLLTGPLDDRRCLVRASLDHLEDENDERRGWTGWYIAESRLRPFYDSNSQIGWRIRPAPPELILTKSVDLYAFFTFANCCGDLEKVDRELKRYSRLAKVWGKWLQAGSTLDYPLNEK